MKRFENKAVVITGGAGGIGMATARMFLQEGARVMLVDLKQEDLAKAKEELGNDNVMIVVADVTQEDQVKHYAQQAGELFGKVDVFFNNAGIEGVVKPIEDYPVSDFDKVIAVNVRGVWLGSKYMVPLMAQGGSIIITSSVAGLMGTANVTAYVASKYADIGIMRSLALELAARNIRVNTVNPSPVDNRMMRSLEEGFSPDSSEEAKSQFEKMIPLQRYAKNDEIASVVLFLGSEQSSFITGTVIPVDGGMTA